MVEILLFIYTINQTNKIVKSIDYIESDYKDIQKYHESNFDGNNSLYGESVSVNSFFDFETDSSINKFVNNKVSFNDLKYEPNDLVPLSGEYIVDTKRNSKFRKEALEKLQELSKDFYDEFQTKIVVVSAYRSYDYQAGIKARGCGDKFCSKPGFSEHQSGLAVDFWEASSEKSFLSKPNYVKYFDWLKNNAHKYGFHNTYQKGYDVDGYAVEPWHWRYLGVKLANILDENNLTIAEYYNMFK